MKVFRNDYNEMWERLYQQRWDGYEFVAFSCNEPASVDQVEFFCTDEEAQMYCFQKEDAYDFLSTRTAYRVMGEGLNNPSLLIEKDGIIDVAEMVKEFHNRITAKQESKHVNRENGFGLSKRGKINKRRI